MTYGKKLTSAVKMDSVWGPVLYCNLLAALPMFLLGYCNGDYVDIYTKMSEIPANGVMILLFSCVAGTLIGYVCMDESFPHYHLPISFFLTLFFSYASFFRMFLSLIFLQDIRAGYAGVWYQQQHIHL